MVSVEAPPLALCRGSPDQKARYARHERAGNHATASPLAVTCVDSAQWVLWGLWLPRRGRTNVLSTLWRSHPPRAGYAAWAADMARPTPSAGATVCLDGAAVLPDGPCAANGWELLPTQAPRRPQDPASTTWDFGPCSQRVETGFVSVICSGQEPILLGTEHCSSLCIMLGRMRDTTHLSPPPLFQSPPPLLEKTALDYQICLFCSDPRLKIEKETQRKTPMESKRNQAGRPICCKVTHVGKCFPLKSGTPPRHGTVVSTMSLNWLSKVADLITFFLLGNLRFTHL